MAAKPDEETMVTIEKAEAKAALIWPKAEERVRLKPEKALAEAQEALAAAKAEVEQERQERPKTEQARAERETALAEATRAIPVEALNPEGYRPALEEEGEQRISFIVRLTVDERGQPRRTEVEHARSGKKETFPTLDVQRLVAFMRACIGPPAIPELAIAPAPSPVRVGPLTPGPPRPVTRLTVSDVRVFRMGAPGVAALLLSTDEAFLVQVRFQLQGQKAPSLTAQESSFEIRVYAREVTRGTSTLLTTHRANLVRDVLEYTPQMQAPRLSRGLHRLVTLVTLDAPLRMTGHRDGPIVHVLQNQPSASPAPLLHGRLPQ
jgi:hypothetical protein